MNDSEPDERRDETNEFDALRALWRASSSNTRAAENDPLAPTGSASIDSMAGNTSPEKQMLVHKLHQTRAQQAAAIRRRDLTETAAAVFVVIFFSMWAWNTNDPLQRAGTVIIVAGALFVVGVMWFGRRDFHEADRAGTPLESCELQLQALRRQQRMLLLVPLWYIAPIVLGIIMISLATMKGWFLVGYLTAVAGIVAGVWYMNARAAKGSIEDDIQGLITLMHELQEPTPCDGDD